MDYMYWWNNSDNTCMSTVYANCEKCELNGNLHDKGNNVHTWNVCLMKCMFIQVYVLLYESKAWHKAWHVWVFDCLWNYEKVTEHGKKEQM